MVADTDHIINNLLYCNFTAANSITFFYIKEFYKFPIAISVMIIMVT